MVGFQEALSTALKVPKDGAGSIGSAGKFATESQRALEIVGITCKQYLSQHGVRRLLATAPDICSRHLRVLNATLEQGPARDFVLEWVLNFLFVCADAGEGRCRQGLQHAQGAVDRFAARQALQLRHRGKDRRLACGR